MTLSADLGGKFAFVFEVSGTDDARFFDAVCQRFFAIDVFAAVHAPIGDKSVVVVGSATDDGFDVFLIQHFPPIHVLLCTRKF